MSTNFFRGTRNRVREDIKDALLSNLGNGINVDDGYISCIMSAISKELSYLHAYLNKCANQLIPSKCFMYINRVEKIYGLSYNKNLSLTERLKRIDVYLKSYKQVLTQTLLYEMLVELAPDLVDELVLFKYDDGLSHQFGTDYLRKQSDYVNVYPTREVLISSGGYTVIGGNTYTYIPGVNDNWFSTILVLGIKIKVDPTTIALVDEQKVQMDLIEEYLLRMLPAHIDVVYFVDTDFILADDAETQGSLLDSYSTLN